MRSVVLLGRELLSAIFRLAIYAAKMCYISKLF